ncbi:Rec8 like protein-domain-containing protein [Cyathus striatus]|nr:Rec8 like protein-domain-containing protein [Cyathus striatus]
MFFSPELLTKRDSGFGLLWLAATLGSRSTVRRLPKRSVLTANITQLCDLVAQPAEPLALRLSSNLMVGVEILMSDVNNCVTSLKKMMQECKALPTIDTEQQMSHATVKPCALTVVPDPRTSYSLDFDAFVIVCTYVTYIIYFNDCRRTTLYSAILDNEDLSIPQSGKVARKTKAALPPSQIESGRQETHTLTEHHDHLLSASFDLSFSASNRVQGFEQSSSGPDMDLELNDIFFSFPDELGIQGELDEDFAKELGWISSPVKPGPIPRNPVDNGIEDQALEAVNEDFRVDLDNTELAAGNGNGSISRRKRKENGRCCQFSRKLPHNLFIDLPKTPVRSSPSLISRKTISVDKRPKVFMPLNDITDQVNNAAIPRKVRRMRLLLDGRTELTDDELKIARARYLEAQTALKKEIWSKRSEKHKEKLIDEMVWGVPDGIEAQALADFWQEIFKVHVESRSNDFLLDENMRTINDRGSSEQPEQARRVSRSESMIRESAFGLDISGETASTPNDSQKSSLFPWDNAVPSSSEYFDPPQNLASADMDIDGAYTRLRSSSNSRRNSSLLPSQNGSGFGGMGLSPGVAEALVSAEDYVFEVDRSTPMEDTHTKQRFNLNMAALEKNSSNFLE